MCAGVFFFFDVSPIRVRIEETSQSFAHFLTGCCAIIGGVFTVNTVVLMCIPTGWLDCAHHDLLFRARDCCRFCYVVCFQVMGLVDKAVHKIVQRSTGGL